MLLSIGAACGSSPGRADESAPHHVRAGAIENQSSALGPAQPPAAAARGISSPATGHDVAVPLPAPREAPAYALDVVSRKVPISGKAWCPPVDLIRYRGTHVQYQKALRINAAFREHLRRFERIVVDTAIEIYGRPPTRIEHFGSYYCRRISTWPFLVSEHGLGNAVDIGGFEFARLRAHEYPEVPKRWRKRYKVSISKHWRPTKRGVEHSRFLRTLARRIIAEPDLFRVILGPGHPRHGGHFHLDMARARVISVF